MRSTSEIPENKIRVYWEISRKLIDEVAEVKTRHHLSRNEDAVEWMLWEAIRILNGTPAGGIVTQVEVDIMRREIEEIKERIHEMELGRLVIPEFYLEELDKMEFGDLASLASKFGIHGENKNQLIIGMMESESMMVILPQEKKPIEKPYIETKTEVKTQTCSNCEVMGHRADKCPEGCSNCGDFTHWSKKCPLPDLCKDCGRAHQGECKVKE